MSQNNTAPHPDLRVHLAAEHAAWQTLLSQLAEEEGALVEGDVDLLQRVNAGKLSQLNTIGDLTRARLAALQASGYSADQTGMDHWLSQRGQTEDAARWQQLREMEPQAKAINTRIGALIDLRLTSTRQALNVLIQAASTQGGLYDQAGQTVAARANKPLASI